MPRSGLAVTPAVHLLLALSHLIASDVGCNGADIVLQNVECGGTCSHCADVFGDNSSRSISHRKLHQTDVQVQVFPKRRDPLNGFRWYTGSLQLGSRNYWAASIWTGYPYMVVAFAWICSALVVSTIRCVCCVQGEGFYPKTYNGSMAWKWYRTTLGVAVACILVKLIALATFTVYSSLAYIEGQDLASTLSRQYNHLSATVDEQYAGSQALQSLIDGDLRVAGRTYSAAFVGDVPAVLPHAKAILDDLGRVDANLTLQSDSISDAYEALIALVLLCCSSGLMILVLFSFSAMFQSRVVLNYSLMALPACGVINWCTASVLYGMWVIANDTCTLTDVHDTSVPGSQLHNSTQEAIFPCPSTSSARSLSFNSKKTHLALSKAVNQLVTDQYNMPVNANFTDEPLLCETFVLEPNQSYTAVLCPYPTSQHRLTAGTWEANSVGMRCSGNNNDLCAAGVTPITQDIFTSVVQLLVHIEAANAVQLSSDAISRCTFAATTMADIASQHCKQDGLRLLLITAWIALMVAGGAGIALAAPVMLLQRMMAPSGIAAVEAVYNPGYSLPLKTVAAGWREEDYAPGMASQVVLTNTTTGTAVVPESPKLNEFFRPASVEKTASHQA